MDLRRRSINAPQSIIHKEYFLFVYNTLAHLCGARFRVSEYLDLRTKKVYTSYVF
jgi:hypothetical protein